MTQKQGGSERALELDKSQPHIMSQSNSKIWQGKGVTAQVLVIMSN